MGMGACAVEARTAASLGALSAVAPDFRAALDVPNGGVLCALPALLAAGLLAQGGEPMEWSAELCRQWMAAAPGQAGVLYVDGHVRVYHGHQTQLPRHYVARQKLCLRATVDYWVNAMDGQPFFAVNVAVDPGLIQVLEQDILPRLPQDVPGQPDARALADDPLLHRFTLVFDPSFRTPLCYNCAFPTELNDVIPRSS